MEKTNYYKKLRELREEKNLTYKMLAKELNISTSYYWQIENKKKRFYYDTAIKIANYFGLRPDDLFF